MLSENSTLLQSKSFSYDAIGNRTGSATSAHTEYTYDDLDRLTSVIKKNPTTSANESKTEFQYDGYSRLRVSKEYTWNGSAWVLTANSEKHRIYDGMDVVQERDENNAVLATYTRDGNIGGILAKRDDNGDDYFFHYDGSGNVIGLTDENESSVAEYVYDAYGNLRSSSGAQASNNTYRYSTKEHFGSIGLYNYGYRFYSPGLGRWISRDPIDEEGGVNLYSSFDNDPVNWADDYGAKPVEKQSVTVGEKAANKARRMVNKGPKDCKLWIGEIYKGIYPTPNNNGDPILATDWDNWFKKHPDLWEQVPNNSGTILKEGDVIHMEKNGKVSNGHVPIFGGDAIYDASYSSRPGRSRNGRRHLLREGNPLKKPLSDPFGRKTTIWRPKGYRSSQ